jgi:hypothetical protein
LADDLFVFLLCDKLLCTAGIVAYEDGFLIALYMTGGVYYVEPENNVTKEVIPLGELALPDGLELVTEEDGSRTLYITEGGSNSVSLFTIFIQEGDTGPTAEKVGAIDGMEGYYMTPGTSAVVGDFIWTSNLVDASVLPAPGENDTSTFEMAFTLVGISRFVDVVPETTDPTASPTSAADGVPDTTDPTASPTSAASRRYHVPTPSSTAAASIMLLSLMAGLMLVSM